MKISELKNAPQWLLDADTENADVDFDAWNRVFWHGGDWHGGDWHDGVWHGGVWHGGVWRGEDLKANLFTAYGLKWPVTITPTRMQIGCERHLHTEWAEFTDERIVAMDGKAALTFWREHKAALLALCATRVERNKP